jgi:outer membrane protein
VRQRANRFLPAHALLAALAMGAVAAQAQTPAPAPAAARIGYLDTKRLIDNMPQTVAAREKLEREFAQRDAALRADETRLEELRSRQNRDAPILTLDAADALQREIDALERLIRRSRDNLRNELKTRTDQETDRNWREIENTIVEFARSEGYDLIVSSPVVYASPRIDVTDRVLERLRRQYQTREGGR